MKKRPFHATVTVAGPSDRHEELLAGICRRCGGRAARGRLRQPGCAGADGIRAGAQPRSGRAGARGESASLRSGGRRLRAGRAPRLVPVGATGQRGLLAGQPGHRPRDGVPGRARRHGAGHGRRPAPARGGRPAAGGRAAGPVRGAARAGQPGRHAGRQRPGVGRSVAADPARLPQRGRDQLRRRGGPGAAAQAARGGPRRDQPHHRGRHPRPGPAPARPGLAGRRRLGAHRRAVSARGLGHALRRQPDQPGGRSRRRPAGR